jgi:hypothetical protein
LLLRTNSKLRPLSPGSEDRSHDDNDRHGEENIMPRNTIFVSLLASSAAALALATPAAASKSDRAHEAIAAAEAKIHTAETLGADTEAPRDASDARAALARAKEDLASHDKDAAIQDAIRASARADTAIGIAQQHKNNALASARDSERATSDAARDQVAAAQGQAAVAREQASSAQDQAVAAQQQVAAAQQKAAEADARASAAEQSAAASAADAQAARNEAALAATQAPAPSVETTITTRQHAASHHVTHKVIRHTTTSSAPGASSSEVTATTKVTPQ